MSTTIPELSTPRLKVILEPGGPESDLVEYTVQTDNRDAVRFDILRAAMRWPDGQAAPVLWMTIQAWSALKRSGVFESGPEAFLDKCLQVTPVDEDGNPLKAGDKGVVADPFQTAPERGY